MPGCPEKILQSRSCDRSSFWKNASMDDVATIGMTAKILWGCTDCASAQFPAIGDGSSSFFSDIGAGSCMKINCNTYGNNCSKQNWHNIWPEHSGKSFEVSQNGYTTSTPIRITPSAEGIPNACFTSSTCCHISKTVNKITA